MKHRVKVTVLDTLSNSRQQGRVLKVEMLSVYGRGYIGYLTASLP